VAIRSAARSAERIIFMAFLDFRHVQHAPSRDEMAFPLMQLGRKGMRFNAVE
jgi:hypothetical protein